MSTNEQQPSANEDLARLLGEVPELFRRVVSALPEGTEREALDAALSEFENSGFRETQRLLREHAEALSPAEVELQKHRVHGLRTAFDEFRAHLQLSEQLQRVVITTAKPDDFIRPTTGEAETISNTIYNSLSTGHAAIRQLPVEDAAATQRIWTTLGNGEDLVLNEVDAEVFNRHFRILHCPEGTAVVEQAAEVFLKEITEFAEEEGEDAKLGLIKVQTMTQNLITHAKRGSAAAAECDVIVEIADAEMLEEICADLELG